MNLDKLVRSNDTQCVPTIGSRRASLTLLSENAFVLPRFSKSFEKETSFPDDTFGYLDLYQFDTHADSSKRPTCIASFALPLLKRQDIQSFIYISCVPTGVTLDPQSSPKVFDLSPRGRLVRLSIWISPVAPWAPSVCAGELYVPSSTLLDILPKSPQQESQRSEHILVS